MCVCLNCDKGELSYSKCYSELQATDVQSVKIHCKLLNRTVVNIPDPRMSMPAPCDCPLKDSVKEKSLSDYFKDSFKWGKDYV